jgi:hypothetical protein
LTRFEYATSLVSVRFPEAAALAETWQPETAQEVVNTDACSCAKLLPSPGVLAPVEESPHASTPAQSALQMIEYRFMLLRLQEPTRDGGRRTMGDAMK